MQFFESFYEAFRVELVRFASQYGYDTVGAEDLFEDSHLALCEGYSDISETEYLKLMKTAIKNRYKNEYKEKKMIWTIPPSVPDDMSLEECVIRKFEMEKVMLSIQCLTENDQDFLLANSINNTNLYKSLKKRAKKRLENKIHEVFVFPENKLIPLCPECDSSLMLFSMENYDWTCDTCGMVTASPLLVNQKEIDVK